MARPNRNDSYRSESFWNGLAGYSWNDLLNQPILKVAQLSWMNWEQGRNWRGFCTLRSEANLYGS